MTVTVDHAAIRSGQLLAITVLAGAFVVDRWEPVAFQAVVFLITALAFRFGPYTLIYRYLLRPLRLVQPDERADNPQPHRFGQAVGALSAGAAAALLYLGHTVSGWIVVGILEVLTAISYLGWCIGCFIYYQLNRLGLGGFFGQPPTDNGVPLGAPPRRTTNR